MKSQRKNSTVAVLLCAYQGEVYIEDQLVSFIEQTYPHWQLYISDDDSRDHTLKIIKRFNFKNNLRPLIFKGPKKGFASNFIDLTKRPSIKADFYAWSDQDDIWQKTKLERAIQWLDNQPSSLPVLYCSITTLVDDLNRYIGTSQIFKEPKTFQNALVQNIAGGNTMIFNEKARQLFIEASKNSAICAHDWLMYQVVTSCGGVILFDEMPSILYRQHSSNIIGNNMSIKSRINRVKQMLQGRFRTWNNQNIYALDNVYNNMTVKNKMIFDHFKMLKKASLLKRFLLYKKSGIYRQTFLQNLGLLVAIIFNKI
jgi:glycosyltransferase involved in cell wall biosynthesis